MRIIMYTVAIAFLMLPTTADAAKVGATVISLCGNKAAGSALFGYGMMGYQGAIAGAMIGSGMHDVMVRVDKHEFEVDVDSDYCSKDHRGEVILVDEPN